jgi:alpha-tubulin suppressor-like RCC1 family protein
MKNKITPQSHLFLFTLTTLTGLLATTSVQAQQVIHWGNNVSNSLSTTSLLPFTQVAAGQGHTIAIAFDATVKGWGENYANQTQAPVGLDNVVEISAGQGFSVAAKRDGTVVCWGDNSQGQCLGTDLFGSPITTYVDPWSGSVPVQINGQTLTNVAHVSAGWTMVLACKKDGSVLSWGAEMLGGIEVPADLQLAGANVVQVAVGQSLYAALKSNGTLAVWGAYAWDPNFMPQDLTGVKQIAACYTHLVALKNDGNVVTCKGMRGGGFDMPALPAGITAHAAISPVTQITTGIVSTTVVFADGTADGWTEDPNADSLHGYVPAEYRGANHSCTITKLGSSWEQTVATVSGTCAKSGLACWMAATTADSPYPVWEKGQTVIPEGVIDHALQVATGDHHTVVLSAKSPKNNLRFFGDTSTNFIASEISVEYLASNPLQMDAEGSHTVVLAQGVSNGLKKAYSLGIGVQQPPNGMSGVKQVTAGKTHDAAIVATSSADWVGTPLQNCVVAWGDNSQGQCLGTDELGSQINFPSTNGATPGTQISMANYAQINGVPVSGVKEIAAGNGNTIALKEDGTVVGWGSLEIWGVPLPIEVPAGLTNVKQISASGANLAALNNDGTVTQFDPMWTPPSPSYGGYTQIDCSSEGTVGLTSTGVGITWWQLPEDPAPWPVNSDGITSVECATNREALAIISSQYLSCGTEPRSGDAFLIQSGSAWQDIGAWAWIVGGSLQFQTPGPDSGVLMNRFATVGVAAPSVDNDCTEAFAGTINIQPGSTMVAFVPTSESASAPLLQVTTIAKLAGRMMVVSGSNGFPEDLNTPVLTCGTADGFFDILQSDIAPPAGKFLTLVPSDVNGRTVFSLRLLPMPSAANLSSTTGASASGVAIAAEGMDFNVDGFDDIALAVQTGSTGLVQVLMNDGLGNLGATSILKALPATPTALAVGDFTGDGTRNDVVVGLTDGTIRVYINNGTGFTAGAVVTLPAGEIPTCVCEIKPGGASRFMATSSGFAVGTSSSNLRTFGSGGGTGTNVPLSSVPRTVHSSDIDDDDLSDVTAAGSTSAASLTGALTTTPTGFLQVVRATSTGFNAETPFDVLGEPVSMQIADIDGDGFPDIVTANRNPQSGGAGSPPPVFALFRNNGGAASFAGATPIAPAGASGGLDLALVDVNSDGVKDIVAVYKTTGANSQAALININTLGAGYPLSIGDSTVISDNNPTLVAKGNLDGNGSEDVFLVQQASQFALSGDSTVAPFLGAQSAPCFGDLDGSGEVDSSDVSLCLLDYGICEGCSTDLDGSGEVDSSDVSLVLLSTGPCN